MREMLASSEGVFVSFHIAAQQGVGESWFSDIWNFWGINKLIKNDGCFQKRGMPVSYEDK